MTTVCSKRLRIKREDILQRSQTELMPAQEFAYRTRESTEVSAASETGRFASVKTSRLQGCELGRYRILDKIGEGAAGVVYRAYDPLLERHVAIKVLKRKEYLTIARFKQEIKAIAGLRHPNIVTLYEFSELDGYFFFTMEQIDVLPGSLVDNAKGNFKFIAKLIARIAQAVYYANSNGILHRDIKPANILLGKSNGRISPKLVDFGLAKIGELSSEFTVPGMLLGTMHYMAPEQARGEVEEIDQRTEVYSLGATLYELLVGHPPFLGKGLDILFKIVETPLPLPRKLNPAIPEQLESICLKAMSKQKQDRYENSADLAKALKDFYKGKM